MFEHADKAGKPWLSVVAIAHNEPRWFDENGERTESYSGAGGTSDTYVNSESGGDEGKEGAGKHSSWGTGGKVSSEDV